MVYIPTQSSSKKQDGSFSVPVCIDEQRQMREMITHLPPVTFSPSILLCFASRSKAIEKDKRKLISFDWDNIQSLLVRSRSFEMEYYNKQLQAPREEVSARFEIKHN